VGGERVPPVTTLDPATRARLVGLFVAEAEETVAALEAHAARLRGDDLGEPLSEFGRVAHGLKGAAAALGYEALAGSLHALEALALGLRGAADGDREDRHGRIASALQVFADGVARMAASGADGFPEDLGRRLGEIVGLSNPTPPARPEASSSPPPLRSGRADGDRLSVPAADVDEALRLAASLARAAAQLTERLDAEVDGAASVAAQSVAASAAGLEAIIAALRLVPAESTLSGIDREVFDLAARLGKAACVAVSGQDVRADRRTLQTARNLIRHLVRNAIDHGLESPGARAEAGKPREGRVSVSVEAGESTLKVEVADDGAGFDLAAIRAEMARRAADGGRVATLSDDEILNLWAFEGGSTREQATEISGRGFGLSAVAQTARAAGGGIRIRTVRGLGSAVTFTLPLEVYAVEVLTVTAGGRAYGVPLASVDRTVHLVAAGDAVHEGPAGRTLAVGETILPLDSLSEATGAASTRRERFAVVVRAEGGMAALAVDDVGAVAGLVPSIVPGVADAEALCTGLARLADGTPLAVLNPRVLLARARAVRGAGRAAPAAAAGSRGGRAGRAALEVVLAEDSLATREVLRVLLEEQGFRVRLAADGEEALARIGEALPDVLVSDVNMPRRDGLSLARALRARRETERLPIVLLTSQDDDAARAAGAAAGADAYLVKSQFNAAVLSETLARLGVRAS
jgi:two-component system, chemotaxis family, sensor kinase CheA